MHPAIGCPPFSSSVLFHFFESSTYFNSLQEREVPPLLSPFRFSPSRPPRRPADVQLTRTCSSKQRALAFLTAAALSRQIRAIFPLPSRHARSRTISSLKVPARAWGKQVQQRMSRRESVGVCVKKWVFRFFVFCGTIGILRTYASINPSS